MQKVKIAPVALPCFRPNSYVSSGLVFAGAKGSLVLRS